MKQQKGNNTLVVVLSKKGMKKMCVYVTKKINEMKKQMINTAKKHEFNFQHPDVIEISQKLDVLIVQVMQNQQPSPSGKVAGLRE
ncbi:aspartyl-phosphate phosphatase Spo0E family protein [Aneurinibacillus sp. Ricciae_BoGa-3]|uniref:aspartyl-phosphate phosphatase Spo0E family protein n=1 Tax=Aneurinibacillus sp. Ricciae_BoGa-3 TaxID=3022697 RepID=UPI0023418C95|nr:aspartyl-phosphate phosphatase Spo0E family protein [Aneurinibacillus sp. Ricciae_BoGa-3]WCK55447.1 aspartyl-phosphate phosphatase Spo0E family protein [Aneurinibacillus sp. Ricciae_BoGa-3]